MRVVTKVCSLIEQEVFTGLVLVIKGVASDAGIDVKGGL